MGESPCAFARCLLERDAHVILPRAIDEIARSVRRVTCDEHGNCIDRQPKISLGSRELGLALPQRLFGTFALVNVDEQVVPADDTPIGILSGNPRD